MLVAGLIVVLAGVWFWFDTLAAREAANDAAKASCVRVNLQFLDGTVAFAQITIASPRRGGWAIRRLYTFEFSSDGMTRRMGHVVADGRRIISVDFPPDTLQ